MRSECPEPTAMREALRDPDARDIARRRTCNQRVSLCKLRLKTHSSMSVTESGGDFMGECLGGRSRRRSIAWLCLFMMTGCRSPTDGAPTVDGVIAQITGEPV